MRVMWIVNTIFPKPAEELGLDRPLFAGWLLGLFEELKKNKKISQLIVATTYNGKILKRIQDNNIVYYLIPNNSNNKYSKKQEQYWKQIKKHENPDVVHIHGTEYPHALCYLNSCGGNNVCTSIQGLINECSKKNNYFADITKFPITIRDIIRNDTVYQARKKFEVRGKYEIKALEKSKIIIGRTNWDKAHSFSITHKNNYEKCNESLRKIFYEKKWCIDNIERHSIFISQASYPLKGFHKMIDAAILLKKKYKDIKIYVAGTNITQNKTLKEKLKLSGYGKLLNQLIKKNELENNIEFTGLLNEEQMCNRLLKSHIFVQASSIENSPNSLGEAMILGMPCVASYVGGTADMLLDKKEGFLYPFGESEMLADYISQIFENDELAIEFGKNAREHAIKTHNYKENANRIIEIYEKVISSTNEK